MNGNARYFVAARQVEFTGTTLNLVRSTGDQRAEGRLSEMFPSAIAAGGDDQLRRRPTRRLAASGLLS